MRFKVNFQGTRFRKDLREAGHELGVKAVAAGIFALANEIMIDAKERAPVDTGAMRASGYVAPPEIGSTSIVLEEGFGGPSKEYVIRQHEDLSLHHPGGGEAKFLERAFDAAAPTAGKKIAAVARQVAGKGAYVPGRAG